MNLKNRTTKKRMVMALSAATAITVFSVTAFASTPSYTGYEALKAWMKESKTQEAMAEMDKGAMAGTFSLTDNGKTLVSVSGNVSVDEPSQLVSGRFVFQAEGVQEAGTFYKAGDKHYLVDEVHHLNYEIVNVDSQMDGRGEGYGDRYGEGHRTWGSQMGTPDEGMSQTEEAILDYLMGDLKNQIQVEQATDGGRTFVMDLDAADIPTQIQMIAGLAMSEANKQADTNERSHDLDTMTQAQKEVLQSIPMFNELQALSDKEMDTPELVSDVKIETVVMALAIDENNEVESFSGKLKISGKDAAGAYHVVELQGNATIEDLGQAAPETFDATGQTMQVIDASLFEEE